MFFVGHPIFDYDDLKGSLIGKNMIFSPQGGVIYQSLQNFRSFNIPNYPPEYKTENI